MILHIYRKNESSIIDNITDLRYSEKYPRIILSCDFLRKEKSLWELLDFSDIESMAICTDENKEIKFFYTDKKQTNQDIAREVNK